MRSAGACFDKLSMTVARALQAVTLSLAKGAVYLSATTRLAPM